MPPHSEVADRRDDPPVPVAGATSFEELYAAHFTNLAVQLYAYFGDRQEAQDVVQEAFCRALRRWRTVSTYDDPVAWVRRVAWNLAISRWRRARTALAALPQLRRQSGDPVEGPGPDHVVLITALAALPARQRRAVVLHYLADMPVTDIADREGVAAGTVKSWLHRARTALTAELDQPDPPSGGAR